MILIDAVIAICDSDCVLAVALGLRLALAGSAGGERIM